MTADGDQPQNATGERLLVRQIGPLLGAAIVVNSTIGSGIFKTPAQVARHAGSIEAALLVWVAGAVIALAGALSFAELTTSMPRAGGIYEFIRRAWGPRVAFLVGWTKITLIIPSAVGGFATLAAEALASLGGWPESPARNSAVAIALIAVCAAANVSRVRTSAIEQAVVTIVKYAGVLALAIAGIALAVSDRSIPPPVDAPTFHTTVTMTGVFAALVSCMWAYDGWADLAGLGGEAKNPGRTLPRALLTGTIAVAAVYLLANVGYARVLGLDGLRASTTGANMAAANLATLTLGDVGRAFLSALVLVSCIGGCMASLLTNSRTFVPMATDGTFVRWLGVVSPRTGTPVRAVLVGAALGGVYVSWRSFEQLTDAFIVGYFPFYALAVAGVFVLRRREPELVRPFRIPLHPIPPIVFLLGALAVTIGAVTELDETALLAFGVMGAGVPLAFWFGRRRQVSSTDTR